MDSQREGGFTLIETILGLVVMSIMVLAVSNLFISNLQSVTLGKARAIGLAVANEQIEYLRDLPYQSVATAGGAIYPPGTIPDSQTLTRGGYNFTVKTEINYVDDPYDGISSGPANGKPKDLNPADYRKAQIDVYLKSSGQLVAKLTTDIAGKAAETASSTGIISIRVIDANGQPVANASVHITNTNPTPDVDITTTTDNQGLVVVPNLPPDSSNRYQVTASLGGYSTDQTLPDPAGAQTAVNINPNVLVQQITPVTLAIDRVSSLNLRVTDPAGAALGNKAITITGAKKTKQNPDVYKYSQVSTTDASGNISLSSMEWDSYSFTPPAGSYLVSSQPYAPAALQPNSSLTVNLVVSASSSYPTVTKLSPTSAPTGTANVSLVITGTNLAAGSNVVLRLAGQSDINVSGEVSSNGNKTLTGTLNLTGAATGTWDVIVTSGGNTVTQAGGFSVTP